MARVNTHAPQTGAINRGTSEVPMPPQRCLARNYECARASGCSNYECARASGCLGTAGGDTKDWKPWDLNPRPSACRADVIPLHHAPLERTQAVGGVPLPHQCKGPHVASSQTVLGPSPLPARNYHRHTTDPTTPRVWSVPVDASAGNRTRVTSMATMYSATRPLMQLVHVMCADRMPKPCLCSLSLWRPAVIISGGSSCVLISGTKKTSAGREWLH